MKKLGGTDLKRLHREWRGQEQPRLALILEDVEGPFNVGSIIRTAAAYRVDRVYLASRTPEPDNPKVGRTALGTDRYLDFERCESGSDAVAAAKAVGFTIVGLELADEAVALHELELSNNVCLVVGHEDRGIANPTLDACDHVAFLPQLGKVGSLNVATATSIAIYELRRRAWV